MLSAFKYRIYPRPGQELRLKRSLFLLCELYNKLRARKIEQYKQRGISLTKTGLRNLALEERKHTTELQWIHSQVVQNVADRLYTAFKGFLEGTTRFPKHKPPKKYLSMTFPQSGFRVDPRRGLRLSGFGCLRIFMHRPLLGRIRRLTIKYEVGEWYAIFITERNAPSKTPIESLHEDQIRGADLGLEKFATLDNSKSVEYPEFLRQSEGKVKILQRRLAHKKEGSKRWREICFALARLHQHVKRQREDFQNKLVGRIFAENDVLSLEKLSIVGMVRNHSLAKSISDVSWGKFTKKAIFKADMLGKHFIAVDPWGTTQLCCDCLKWVPKDLAERNHLCPDCGIKISRDLNSARLIKRLGIHSGPPSDWGSSPAESGPLPSLRGVVSRDVEAGSHRS